MIKKFFQHLNNLKIQYFLISGQATVLYGAATFSEDIDLWVSPEIENWEKFIEVVRITGGKVYKVTPPLYIEFIRKGHGFHFEFPAINKEPEWFLDVMGVVPRAGSFKNARKKVSYHKTLWGKISVVGIKDLVEIKKTRRLEDYSIISNLVNIFYKKSIKNKRKPMDWKWILLNSFKIEDLVYYLEKHKEVVKICQSLDRKCLKDCIKIIKYPDKREKYFTIASRQISLEIEKLREKDRIYWQGIIKELKDLNSKGMLLRKGSIPKIKPAS